MGSLRSTTASTLRRMSPTRASAVTTKISDVNVGSGKIRSVMYIIILVILLASGLYSVGADEVGVIQRFGKFVRSTEPGLHLKIPLGVESVAKVKVKKVFKQEFGFRSLKADVRTLYSSRSYL